MSLVNDFYKYTDQIGISKDDIYKETGDGFTLISFGEEVEQGSVFNVALVIYDNDDSVEVYIRKQINCTDELGLLRKLNNMNAEYCGASFFTENNVVSIKSYCKTNGNLDIALAQMIQNMQVAKEEFTKL